MEYLLVMVASYLWAYYPPFKFPITKITKWLGLRDDGVRHLIMSIITTFFVTIIKPEFNPYIALTLSTIIAYVYNWVAIKLEKDESRPATVFLYKQLAAFTLICLVFGSFFLSDPDNMDAFLKYLFALKKYFRALAPWPSVPYLRTPLRLAIAVLSMIPVIDGMSNELIGGIVKQYKLASNVPDAGLPTGRYIGTIERVLTIFAVCFRAETALVGLYAAKTAVRYGQFSQDTFGEYYLIGTMLSASIGVIIGIALLRSLIL